MPVLGQKMKLKKTIKPCTAGVAPSVAWAITHPSVTAHAFCYAVNQENGILPCYLAEEISARQPATASTHSVFSYPSHQIAFKLDAE